MRKKKMLKILIKKHLSELVSSTVANFNSKTAKKGKRTSVGMIVLIAVLFTYIIGVFSFMMVSSALMICVPLVENGYAWFYFALPFGMDIVITVFLGIFSSQGHLFNAKDNDLLLSMPIRPRDILASRIIVMMLPDYLIGILITGVFGGVYAWFYGVTFVGTLIFCLMMLTVPLLSVAIYSLVGWAVSAITARIKRKQLVTTAVSLAFLALYFYLYSGFMNAMTSFEESADMSVILGSLASVADKISTYLPPLKWIGAAVAEQSAVYTLLSLAVTVIPFVIVLTLISRSFIGIVTAKRGTKKTRYDAKRSIKATSAVKALYLRELGRTLNCSTYLMNAGIGALMTVIMAVFITQGDMGEMMASVSGILPGVERLLTLGAAFLICLVSSTVMFTASSVSLEGKQLWIIRSLPVESEKILLAKVALHMTFAAPASLIASGILCLIARPNALEAIPYFLLPIVFNLFAAFWGLVINLRFPKLVWTNEIQPVKQGLASLLGMFGSGIAAFVIVGGAFLITASFIGDSNKTWICAAAMTALTVVFALGCLILYKVLKKWGVRRFETL